jgi:hypothetical protein
MMVVSQEATCDFTGETITSLMTDRGVLLLCWKLGRVNGVAPLSGEGPRDLRQIRVHEKSQQFAKFLKSKRLDAFSFDIHLTSFSRKSAAHGGTLWRIMVHYGSKTREKWAATNLLC